ncbi:MAG: hypothetical protein AAGG00_15465 [Cyanobacteria bacterium P01_H01_bin.150]
MIFYKLPKIAKKISILAGRIKNLIKLIEKSILKKRYVIQVLEAEEKIAKLEQTRENVLPSKGVLTSRIEKIKPAEPNHVTPKQLSEDFETYLRFEEERLFQYLDKGGIKVILSELLDDCLSVLTDKGHVLLDKEGWEVTCTNQEKFKSRFLDLAIEPLWL